MSYNKPSSLDDEAIERVATNANLSRCGNSCPKRMSAKTHLFNFYNDPSESKQHIPMNFNFISVCIPHLINGKKRHGYTALFVCPRTGEPFASGDLRDKDDRVLLRQQQEGRKCSFWERPRQSLYFYDNKKKAENAAAGKALDNFYARREPSSGGEMFCSNPTYSTDQAPSINAFLQKCDDIMRNHVNSLRCDGLIAARSTEAKSPSDNLTYLGVKPKPIPSFENGFGISRGRLDFLFADNNHGRGVLDQTSDAVEGTSAAAHGDYDDDDDDDDDVRGGGRGGIVEDTNAFRQGPYVESPPESQTGIGKATTSSACAVSSEQRNMNDDDIINGNCGDINNDNDNNNDHSDAGMEIGMKKKNRFSKYISLDLCVSKHRSWVQSDDECEIEERATATVCIALGDKEFGYTSLFLWSETGELFASGDLRGADGLNRIEKDGMYFYETKNIAEYAAFCRARDNLSARKPGFGGKLFCNNPTYCSDQLPSIDAFLKKFYENIHGSNNNNSRWNNRNIKRVLDENLKRVLDEYRSSGKTSRYSVAHPLFTQQADDPEEEEEYTINDGRRRNMDDDDIINGNRGDNNNNNNNNRKPPPLPVEEDGIHNGSSIINNDDDVRRNESIALPIDSENKENKNEVTFEKRSAKSNSNSIRNVALESRGPFTAHQHQRKTNSSVNPLFQSGIRHVKVLPTSNNQTKGSIENTSAALKSTNTTVAACTDIVINTATATDMVSLKNCTASMSDTVQETNAVTRGEYDDDDIVRGDNNNTNISYEELANETRAAEGQEYQQQQTSDTVEGTHDEDGSVRNEVPVNVYNNNKAFSEEPSIESPPECNAEKVNAASSTTSENIPISATILDNCTAKTDGGHGINLNNGIAAEGPLELCTVSLLLNSGNGDSTVQAANWTKSTGARSGTSDEINDDVDIQKSNSNVENEGNEEQPRAESTRSRRTYLQTDVVDLTNPSQEPQGRFSRPPDRYDPSERPKTINKKRYNTRYINRCLTQPNLNLIVENYAKGYIKCPLCSDIITVGPKGCKVISCTNQKHRPNYHFFCYHCKAACVGDIPSCECSHLNNDEKRRIEQEKETCWGFKK